MLHVFMNSSHAVCVYYRYSCFMCTSFTKGSTSSVHLGPSLSLSLPHTYINTHIHTYMHSYIYTHIRIMHVCMYIHHSARAYREQYVGIQVCMYMGRVHTKSVVRVTEINTQFASKCMCGYICVCVYIYIYTHTGMHTYMPT